MKHLVIVSLIAVVALAGPVTTQPWANDAHHPEKAAKKPTKGKAKQPKRIEKPKKQETLLGILGQKV